MSIEVTCECGTTLAVPDAAAGRVGRCSMCGCRISIPTAEETARKIEREFDPRFAERRHHAGMIVDTSPVRGFWSDAALAFALNGRPVNLGPLLVVWVFHMLLWLLRYGLIWGMLGRLVIFGWLCAFCLNVITETAAGEDEIPTLKMDDGVWEGMVVPFFEFVGSMVAVMAPALICLIFAVQSDSDALFIAARVLSVVGILAWPAAILMVSLHGWTAPFHLDMLVLTIVRSLGPYTAILLLIGAVIFLDALLLGLLLGGNGTAEGGPSLGFGTSAIAQLIQSYALIVTMRCIGLYYRHFKHRFPWSAE